MNEIAEEFDKFCDSVKKMIRSDNSEFNNSLTKFMKRYDQFSESQRVSPFQNFGSIFMGKARSKIKVRPTAVSRRKSKIGSRQKQSTVKTKILANRPESFKRKHNISDIVDLNIPSAKKAGRSRISNTKYFKKNMKNTQ